MARGRPRLFDPSIPEHIEQARIPKGAYWNRRNGNWFALVGGKRCPLAGRSATIADLARLLEEVAGAERGTLGYLCERFHDSPDFKGLALGTQRDYAHQLKLLRTLKTRTGMVLASLRTSGISKPFIQRLVDKLGAATPTKANHLLRYLRRVFAWGEQRGYMRENTNPARGVKAARERKRRRLPSDLVHRQVLAAARAAAALPARSEGAFSAYLPVAMELGYLLRLRPIEVCTLTDANETKDGIQTNRRKGSRDTLVLWSPRLEAAWRGAQAYRARVWAAQHRAVPMAAEQRPLLVNDGGKPVTRDALKRIWQDFMRKLVADSVITAEQHFGMHDFKRKGISDTEGTRADKREASGHRQDSMMDVYDLSIARVTTPKGV